MTSALLTLIDELLTEIRRGARPQNVNLDSSLERDLGLDSLSRVELIARIEQRFSLALPERVFAEVETPRDLLRELQRANARLSDTTTTTVPPLQRDMATGYPHHARTLVEVLTWHVQTHPQRPHIQIYDDRNTGERIDYLTLHSGASKVAAGLQQQGLLPGQAVAIMLPTSKDYFFAFFGILYAGGIPAPIYPPTRPNQLEEHLRRHTRILDNCRAVSMITVSQAKPVARLLKSQLQHLQYLTTVAELQTSPAEFTPPAIQAQDTAFLQYTSGSTGTPKGVVLSHANLLANIRAMGGKVQAGSSDVFVSWLPLYHDMGLIGAWLGSLYYGALLVVMSPLSFLARPQRWLQAIHRYRGTLSAAPNFGYELCVHRLAETDLADLDLSSWRAAFNGAEAVSAQTITQFVKRFQAFGFRPEAMMPVYGLAENSVGLCFPPLSRGIRIDRIQRDTFLTIGHAVPAGADDASALRFVGCGQPLTGHEIRIVDKAGNELPERQQGRLEFRGPSATSGYLRNPTANEALFDDSWLDTGDLAYLSEGELYVTGRIKDIIIRGGRNLYPDELEEAVGDIPEIRKGRVAVFGATDPASATERLVILAETRKKDPIPLAELQRTVNAVAHDLTGRAADDVVLARPNTVLKTSSGKIRRSACRDLYENGLINKGETPLWQQLTRQVLHVVMAQWRMLRHRLAGRLWRLNTRVVFWLLAPITWLLVILLPAESWRWHVMAWAVRTLMRLTACPLHIEGREHLPDKGQSCIYVSNHASYLDGPLVIAAINRPFAFVAKGSLAPQLIAGTFLRRIGAEFVERFDAQKGVDDFRRIARGIAGRSLFFFPEGTFTRTPGLLPFRFGAFIIAAETGMPVIPIAIRGTRSILRGSSHTPHRGTARIRIGPAISLTDLADTDPKDTWSIALALRNKARDYILRHSGEPDSAES